VVLDCGGQVQFLTLTQGFYGNDGGKECSSGKTAAQLITSALSTGDLQVGLSGRSFTLRQSVAADDATCLIMRLPAGGASKQLPSGNGVFSTNCNTTTNLPLKNGKFSNILLGQTITLGLNLKFEPTLGNRPLTDVFMTTQAMDYVDGICRNGNDVPLASSDRSFYIPPPVLSALGVNNKVGDLYALANSGLGGAATGVSGSAPLDSIALALRAINNGFDNFRRLVAFSPAPLAPLGRTESADGGPILTTPGEYSLSVNYPNPFNPATIIKFALPEPSVVRLSVFNMLGEEVSRLADGVVEVGDHSIAWNANDVHGRTLSSGVYFYRLHATSLTGGKGFSKVQKMLLLK